MLVIPVIDIQNGRSVRMVEGLEDKTVYYSESPLNMARLFRKENAKVIHISDLDGAVSGKRKNYELIKEITENVGVPIQLGGGIRTFEIANQLIRELGVYRIVIGTSAIDNIDLIKKLIDEFGKSKVAISVDVRNGYLVKDGWGNVTNIHALEFALGMKKLGVERIIYQDVARVGTLTGLDVEGLKQIASETGLKVTAAGGVSNYSDLRKIQDLERFGVDSVMLSRALYENKFPCQAIWREQEKIDTSLELPKVK
ncbi:MAG TPA: 1-(5-phosphoribosyl)-5-[(5-phosphoribosylamino)methylideneamino] imidazole-4-carboxamide isomerase [Ignavibacteria bacterium]|nr:1-(5-phosphoribosyl)-5-[(5-phosphoribosylamino)methylideneamino] imidazole-4-carboxamide isomerase [Ignavibacteria bacterium]